MHKDTTNVKTVTLKMSYTHTYSNIHKTHTNTHTNKDTHTDKWYMYFHPVFSNFCVCTEY